MDMHVGPRTLAGLMLAACCCAAGVATDAAAQSLEGEWTNTPSSCGQYSTNNVNIRVRRDGYGVLENFCRFTGGQRESATHWRMYATCSGEGGSEDVDVGVELQVVGGKLRLDVGLDTLYYSVKCGSSPDRAEQRTYWDHNGSVMYLVAEGHKRRFFYSQPRGGIAEAGAETGSLLFEGTSDGSSYVGTAYIFNRACGTFPYRVRGPILDDHRRVVLRGMAPRIGANCAVASHFPDVLEFELEPGQ